MRTLTYISTILFSCALLYTPYTYADDAVVTMANIVISLKHFPSDSDKSALAAIGESDSSNGVKAVAQAITGISNFVDEIVDGTIDELLNFLFFLPFIKREREQNAHHNEDGLN